MYSSSETKPRSLAKTMLVLRLHVPQGAQAESVHAEDAGVADAHQDPGGALRERADRGASLHVRVLELGAHALDLIDDRREEQLDRLHRR